VSTLNVNNINEAGGVDAVITAGVLDSGSLPAGSVLQIVRATDGTQRTTTSSSYVDANISVSITPTSASSNLILVWSLLTNSFDNSSASTVAMFIQMTDSSNNTLSGAENSLQYLQMTSGSPRDLRKSTVMVGFVAAGSTSARTYKGRFRAADSTTARINNQDQTGQLFAIEVAA